MTNRQILTHAERVVRLAQAVHRISDAAEAALHRVCKDSKMGDFISKLIIEYERGLTFEGRTDDWVPSDVGTVYGPDGKPLREYDRDGRPM